MQYQALDILSSYGEVLRLVNKSILTSMARGLPSDSYSAKQGNARIEKRSPRIKLNRQKLNYTGKMLLIFGMDIVLRLFFIAWTDRYLKEAFRILQKCKSKPRDRDSVGLELCRPWPHRCIDLNFIMDAKRQCVL